MFYYSENIKLGLKPKKIIHNQKKPTDSSTNITSKIQIQNLNQNQVSKIISFIFKY